MHAMMDQSKQSKLFGRILSKLKGENRPQTSLEKKYSVASTSMSDSLESLIPHIEDAYDVSHTFSTIEAATDADDDQGMAADIQDNAEYRYGGQCLTPEQLPAFCDQLNHLVEVVRNIQSYAAVTGEYPSELERRLERSAREVHALAAEARHARDVVSRTQQPGLGNVVVYGRNTFFYKEEIHGLQWDIQKGCDEMRELECTVRQSDRKLYKSWETLKESTDPNVFEPLLDEIRNKQTALECLTRLIESKRAHLMKNRTQNKNDELHRRRIEAQNNLRRSIKRRRNERGARSVPLSNEPSQHATDTHGTSSASRYRFDPNGVVALTTLELPSCGSVRDIFIFSGES